MAILLYPTRRELDLGRIPGPVIIVERVVQHDLVEKYFTSVYANRTAIDRREHASQADAINAAIERDRRGVRLKKPSSFFYKDPSAPAQASTDAGLNPDGTPISAAENKGQVASAPTEAPPAQATEDNDP